MEFDRLERVVRFVESRLAESDPFLAARGVLDEVQKNADGTLGALTAYQNTGDPSHLSQAQRHGDALVRIASQLAVPLSLQDLDGLREHVSSFRRSAGKHLANLERDAEELRGHIAQTDQARGESLARLGELREEIKQDKGRLDAAISEFQSQFSKAQEARRTEFAQEQKAREATYQGTLQKAQGELAEVKLTFGSDAAEAVEAFHSQGAAARLEEAQIAKSHLDALSDLEDQAAQIVGAIARTGMAGGYQQEADSQQKSARIWRWVVVGSLVGLAIAAGYALLAARQPGGGGLDLGVFLARLGLGIPMAVMAGYGMRQADRHERTERRLRKIQLELASLTSYLELMPEEQRQAIQHELVSRFFSQDQSDGADTTESSIQLAATKQALELLKDLIKR